MAGPSAGRQGARMMPHGRQSQAEDKENLQHGKKQSAALMPLSDPSMPGRSYRVTGAPSGAPLSDLSNLSAQQDKGLSMQSPRHKVAEKVTKTETQVSKAVMDNNFEECMKMATDNRINASNSWNFALIDYFHDMSLLREGDGINFTKASCTLDGCIKIYTSRVDSIAAETGKLLSGLAEERSGGARDSSNQDESLEGDDEDGKRTRRRPAKMESTLVKDFNTLSVKKFELDFAVDPLFQKTSADFDEGGARGLLLNHLCVDSTGRVVFDSTDAGIDPEETVSINAEVSPDLTLDDFESLRECFAVDLDSLDDYVLCPTLKDYKLTKDQDAKIDPALSNLHQRLQSDDLDQDVTIGNRSVSPSRQTTPSKDFFADDYEDVPADFGDDLANGFSENEGDASLGAQLRSQTSFVGRKQPGDVDQTNELVVAMNGLGIGEDRDAMFSYFDQAFAKRGAGQQHWGMRQVALSSKAKGTPTKDQGTPKATRRKAKPALGDFLDESSIPDEKIIFKRPQKPESLLQPKSALNSRSIEDMIASKGDFLLPPDLHFGSRQLLRLFTKPRCSIRVRRVRSQVEEPHQHGPEAGAAFWAATQNPQTDERAPSDAGIDLAAQYEDQFFGETGQDLSDMTDNLDFDALHTETPSADVIPRSPNASMSHSTAPDSIRRVRPEYVSYARVVKKVDVKRLKDDLWTQIERDHNPLHASTPSLTSATSAPSAITFSGAVSGLRQCYTAEKLKDISTSYCFICLLHLANEKDLRIEGSDNLADLSISKDI